MANYKLTKRIDGEQLFDDKGTVNLSLADFSKLLEYKNHYDAAISTLESIVSNSYYYESHDINDIANSLGFEIEEIKNIPDKEDSED